MRTDQTRSDSSREHQIPNGTRRNRSKDSKAPPARGPIFRRRPLPIDIVRWLFSARW